MWLTNFGMILIWTMVEAAPPMNARLSRCITWVRMIKLNATTMMHRDLPPPIRISDFLKKNA